MKRYFIFSCLALVSVYTLVKLDHFFLKQNDGFCFHYILSPQKYQEKWDIKAAFPDEILSQKFTYLGKGSQTFVFESEDKQHVIKFYKFPSHMRQIPWLKRPLSYQFNEKRQENKAYNIKRFHRAYDAYKMAFTDLKEETGLVYIHLNPTSHLHKTITLVDKMGASYPVSLDKMGFVIQKKATLFLPALEEALQSNQMAACRSMIDDVFRVIHTRCQKGIKDPDAMMDRNFGWVDGRVIVIDAGRFTKDCSVQNPEAAGKETAYTTQHLAEYLQKKSPELLLYYQELLLNN